jgi:two-component system sensor histidine kinase UhpB
MAANMIVVLGGAVVGTALTQQFVIRGTFTPLTHALMVLAAIILSGALTAAILHLAFAPLRALRTAIEAARPSGWPASPAPSAAALDAYGDPDIVAVAQAVRRLWERLDQHVRLLEETNRRLEEQRGELGEKTVQLRRLATLVLAAQEEERRRIARELHDDTMQSMAAMIMGIERGRQALAPEAPDLAGAHRTLLRLEDLAVRSLDELRHLALDLRPSVLDDHGLPAAVRWLAQMQRERFGLHSRLELRGDFGKEGVEASRLPPAVETALFRIVQEALTNVARHAQASQAVVRLHRDAEHVCAEIEDDGIGLPEGAEEPDSPPGHMGLFNMRERAALLGGTCTFARGATGRGTVVRVCLPLAERSLLAHEHGGLRARAVAGHSEVPTGERPWRS